MGQGDPRSRAYQEDAAMARGSALRQVPQRSYAGAKRDRDAGFLGRRRRAGRNANDAPPPVAFTEGWAIGKPDVVVEMPRDFLIPAAGAVEYQYIVLPTGFTEDKWVQVAEARPGNRKLVHHMIAFVREPGNNWLKDAQPGVPFVPKRQEDQADKRDSVRTSGTIAARKPSCLLGLRPRPARDGARAGAGQAGEGRIGHRAPDALYGQRQARDGPSVSGSSSLRSRPRCAS